MHPRPRHLTPENAAKFQLDDVVAHYHLRQPYPPQTFNHLASLITDEPRHVLDVGIGDGALARYLLPYVDRIDGIDISAAMMAAGMQLPHGDDPKINWMVGRAEDWQPDTQYALIVGGDAFHWLDWEVAFPKFADMLTANGHLAIVVRHDMAPAWQDDLMTLIRQYSSIQNYEMFVLKDELVKRGLFDVVGFYETPPNMVTQSVDDYIGSFHSRASLSHTDLGEAKTAAFDLTLRAIVSPYAKDGWLRWPMSAKITWGKPLR